MGFSFNINSLNPLNYFSNSVMQGMEDTLLLILYTLLNTILSTFSLFLNTFFDSINGILLDILFSSEQLGPLGMPVFTMGITITFLSLFVFFKFVHNLPVVGDFL